MTSVTCRGKSSEKELDPDDDDNGFLEISGYMAKESIANVSTGRGLKVIP